MKKEYNKPEISNIKIDKEISLILMTYDDVNNPPPPPGDAGPGGAAGTAANPFQDNAFSKPLE
jgi:hypothetical protein